jgi:hypothetical protein
LIISRRLRQGQPKKDAHCAFTYCISKEQNAQFADCRVAATRLIESKMQPQVPFGLTNGVVWDRFCSGDEVVGIHAHVDVLPVTAENWVLKDGTRGVFMGAARLEAVFAGKPARPDRLRTAGL